MSDHCIGIGTLLIVAAPSGGGKTSLVRQLVSDLSDIEVSISHTTRQSRPGEIEGEDYFFVDDSTFKRMVKDKAFMEHAQVFDHSYGTSTAQVEARLQAGIDVVLDIDWQGAQQIKSLFPLALSVFVIPPSVDILKQRLLDRQQDNAQVIENRMQRAQNEMSHFDEFDYLIVNDDFTTASSELKSIVIANRLRMDRQVVQKRKLLSFLLASR